LHGQRKSRRKVILSTSNALDKRPVPRDDLEQVVACQSAFMTAAKVLVLGGIVGSIFVMVVLSMTFMKFFARGRTLLNLLLAIAISAVLIAFYYYVRATVGLSSSADAVAAVVMLVLSGAFIARRPRAVEIEQSWLGVGGRAILGLLVLGLVLMAL
jgi:hypothetical protein